MCVRERDREREEGWMCGGGRVQRTEPRGEGEKKGGVERSRAPIVGVCEPMCHYPTPACTIITRIPAPWIGHLEQGALLLCIR